MIELICEHCQQPFEVAIRHALRGQRYCSRKCAGLAKRNGYEEHRKVYEATHGPIPPGRGHHVHHVNKDPTDHRPDNLTLLTSAEHRRVHSPDLPRGAEHPMARLSEADVHDIRYLYSMKAASQHGLAAMYGVSAMTINLVVRRKIWKHI